MVAVIPVLRSSKLTAVESLTRYCCGNIDAVVTSTKTIRNKGANACISIAAAHRPLTRRAMAVDSPHPGQVVPIVDRIGHCHPPIPVATSTIWIRPIPRKMPTSWRLDSNGPNTGVKNHPKGRDLPGSPERAVFSGRPYAGLYDSTILAISTCN